MRVEATTLVVAGVERIAVVEDFAVIAALALQMAHALLVHPLSRPLSRDPRQREVRAPVPSSRSP